MRPTRLRALIVVPAILLVLSLAIPAFAQAVGAPTVPVTVATVTRRDVPIVVRAIGTVQPFQSVLIRARVDGTLEKVLFTEGQHVKPGDLLAELDPRPYQAILDQALAKKAADQATLVQAQADMVRYVELAGSQVASRQRLDQARAAVGQAEATVRGDDATIAAAQLNLSFTRIVSPIEGRVGLRLVDPGNFIRVADNNSTGIVQITQIRPIALLFTLPQDTLPQVQAAMKRGKLPGARLQLGRQDEVERGRATDDGQRHRHEYRHNQAEGRVRQHRRRAVAGSVRECSLAARHATGRANRAAPTAVQRGPDGLYVYLVKPDSTVIRQSVDIEQDDGKNAVVSRGLDGGETIVVVRPVAADERHEGRRRPGRRPASKPAG